MWRKLYQPRPVRKILQEQRSIQIGEKVIDFKLRRDPRAKHFKLAIASDGLLRMTAPVKTSISTAEQFIRSQAEWITATQHYKQTNPRSLPSSNATEYQQYKEHALLLAQTKVAQYNKYYRTNFKSITIRNQKTRWGSCSKAGNLNFSYRIALLPEPLADYIVVHELCHLREFNHPARFWELVSQTIPDYQKRRQALNY